MMSGGRFTIGFVRPEWFGSKAPILYLTGGLEQSAILVYSRIKKGKINHENTKSGKHEIFFFRVFVLS
jgi:hypothetical protein